MTEPVAKVGRFSTYAVLTASEYHFKKEPKLLWRFRPAASRDELAMTTFATLEGNFPGPNGDTVVRYPNIIEIAWRELAILFAGSNIPMSEISPEDLEKCATQEEADKLIAALPCLPDNATVPQVEALLASMPHAMITEAWAALGDANPGWGPRKNTQEKKAS